MKTSEKQRRQLTLKETKALEKIKLTAQKDIERGYRIHYLLTAAIIGIIGVFLANWTSYGFLKFIFGTISVLSFGTIVFVPYEIYKDIRKAKKKIKEIDELFGRMPLMLIM